MGHTNIVRSNSWIKQYPFMLLLVCLLTGILLQTKVLAVPGSALLVTEAVTLMAFACFHLLASTSAFVRFARFACCCLCFTTLGGMLSTYEDVRQASSWYGHYIDSADAIRVRLAAAPEPKEKTVMLPVAVEGIRVNGQWKKVKGSLRLYVYRSDSLPDYKTGTVFLLPNKLVPVKNSGNPFGFDYAAYAARNGLFHQAFLSSGDLLVYGRLQTRPGIVQKTKEALMTSIRNNVADSTTRALIEATLLNERASLDDELWQAYSVTGIVHIIAISGTHIMMLCGILLFLLKVIPGKKMEGLKYLAAVLLVWFYIALTGFPPSAVRAAVMFTLIAAGIRLNRESNSINTWAAAAFLLLCYNPYWLYDVGIQLSFLSVLSILIYYQPVKRWCTPGNKITVYLWEGIAISIAAQILVFPLALYYFHQFPLLSILANIPAAIYSFLLMTGSLLLFTLDSAGFPAAWLGLLLTWLSSGFHFIILLLAAATPRVMQHLYIDAIDFWLMMAVIVLYSCFLFRKGGIFLPAALSVGCLLVGSFLVKDTAAAGQQHIIVYNTTKQTNIDIVTGKTTRHLGEADASANKNLRYSMLPARLGLRAMTITKTGSLVRQAVSVAGKNILIMKGGLQENTSSEFHIHYLVVNSQCRFQPEVWKNTFRPELVIIDGSLPRWKAIKWKAELGKTGLPVHWVGENGAWIYPLINDR